MALSRCALAALMGLLAFAACAPEDGPTPDPTPGGQVGAGASAGGAVIASAGSTNAGTAGNAGSALNGGGASAVGGLGGASATGGTANAGGAAGAGGNASVAGNAGAAGTGGATSSEPWPGCHSIFDGKTFDGWESTSGWSIVDGALHSLGAGRGQISTVKDYKEFRWIFSLRHQPGNHNPCTLLWGHSHSGDAFGGSIQIQAPACTGWDYRAGHNDAIKVDCPQPQPKIDMSKWTQCEIIARASGKVKMACCQLSGNGDQPCKGIENLHYDDATAPTLGPIGYQMHNQGLFDEYKDICVEENPASSDFLTTQ